MGSCLSFESRSPLHASQPGTTLGLKRSRSSKRKSGARPSFDRRNEDKLHRIPGRMFLNGDSDSACLFTQQGKKGTNQDAMIVWENFGPRKDTVFCGVFDGHGPFGHLVAKKVRDSLPLKLSAHWEVSMHRKDSLKKDSFNKNGAMDSENASSLDAEAVSKASIDSEGTEKKSALFHALKESLLKSFKVMDRELRMHKTIDCFCSGTTAVTMIKQGKDIVIGNVGDSRAVLGTRDKDNCLQAIQLTVDLKPNLPEEEDRIRRCRGRVFALQDEPEVARVWLPHTDSPGLAMARAFGDFCLKDFGLISVPEISYRRLTDNDEFIVLATDGIWDVLSNQQVVDIVSSSRTRSAASRSLVDSAVRAWRLKFPTSKIDDCAVVCLFLNPGTSAAQNSTPVASGNVRPEEGEGGEEEEDVGPVWLGRSGTVRNGEKEVGGGGEGLEDVEVKNKAEEWCALDGVSRVNTLVNLPRFVIHA